MSGREPKDPFTGEVDQIDQLLSDFWRTHFGGGHHGFCPRVDTYQTEDPAQIVVTIELPGVDPDEVKVVLEDARTLVVAGERVRPRSEGRRYQQMEIDRGPFRRRIQLHEDVEAGAASAGYDRGLLRIVLPVAKRPANPVRVPIEVRSKP